MASAFSGISDVSVVARGIIFGYGWRPGTLNSARSFACRAGSGALISFFCFVEPGKIAGDDARRLRELGAMVDMWWLEGACLDSG